MAANFLTAKGLPNPPNACESRGCNTCSEAVATYLVNEKKRLCRRCAQEKSTRGAISPEGESQSIWFCKRHPGEQAEYFCCTDKIPVCKNCAIASHQKPCDLEVIKDAKKVLQNKLEELYGKGLDDLEKLRHFDANISKEKLDIRKHFHEQEEAIVVSFEEMDKEIERRRKECNARIREEAEEKINRIYLTRDAQLLENDEEATKQQKNNQTQKENLVKNIRQAAEDIASLIKEVEEGWKRLFDEARDATGLAKAALFDERCIFRDGIAAEAALLRTSSMPANSHLLQDAIDLAKAVRFSRSGATNKGSLSGLTQAVWSHSSTVTLPEPIVWPRVRFLSENRVAVLDIDNDAGILYSIDLEQKVKEKVAQNVADITFLRDNMCAYVHTTRSCISVCKSADMRRVQDLPIPSYCKGELSDAILSADCHGKLYAKLQSGKIYKYESKRDRLVLKGEIDVKATNNDMVVLSSGDIVVKNHRDGFVVVHKEGGKTKIKRSSWDMAEIAVDRTTDQLYVLYLNRKEERFGVDVPPFTGEEKEVVLGCRELLKTNCPTHFDVFASTMCIFNDNKLLVFKKMIMGGSGTPSVCT